MDVIIEEVCKSFIDANGMQKTVLKNINIEIEKGEFICVLGHSGCGKSTLLNLVAGYMKPDIGQIVVDGERVLKPSPKRGVVFQDHALFPWSTVLDNIAFGPLIKTKNKKKARSLAMEYVDMIGLKGHENEYPYSLSGGMKQRVGIARALINNPEVLLMDEPLGALDALTRESMRRELLNVWERFKTTIIFITHSVAEAVYLADRVILIEEGKVGMDIRIDIDRPRDVRNYKYTNYIRMLEDRLTGTHMLNVSGE